MKMILNIRGYRQDPGPDSKKKVTDPDKSRAKAAVAGIVRKAGLQQLPDSEKLEDVEDDVMQQLNRVLGRK